MNNKVLGSALSVAVIYALLGALWITFSDWVVQQLTSDPAVISELQTYKGWFYVAVTAGVLFFLVYRALAHIEKINQLDPLTGLFRHYQFKRYLEDLTSWALRENQPLLLIYLDCDGFKTVNKQLGYDRADDFLASFAEKLRSHYRAKTVLGRLGADQFAIATVVPGGFDRTLSHINQLFQETCTDYDLDLTYSCGIAMAPDDSSSAKELMSAVSTALKLAKTQGGGRARYFNREISQQEDERQTLVRELKTAIRERQLTLVYQPQFSIPTGELTGIEVLIRWKNPRRGFIAPDVFIALAEEHHLVSQISRFVLRQANRELAGAGLLEGPIQRVSINVSAVEFSDRDLMDRFYEHIKMAEAIAPYLQLEITETAALSDLNASRKIMTWLKRRGLHFSIDDFGTGFSSLALLKDLPIDEIKIDRSFVSDITRQSKSGSIIEAIVYMANKFDISVVAEGVETKAQLEMLREYGCHEAQGFLLGVPVDIQQLQAIVSSDHQTIDNSSVKTL